MQIMVGLRHGTIFLLRIIVIRRAWVGAQSGFGMMTRLPPAAVSRGIPTKTWKSSLMSVRVPLRIRTAWATQGEPRRAMRSEEHTSELQSLMRISYAVFCLKKKKKKIHNHD